MTHPTEVTLLTGFPTTFLATRVLGALLATDPQRQLRCVVQPKFRDRAEERLRALPAEQRGRVRILEGDASHMDLGLSGHEFNELAKEVHVIHHCAAVTYLGVQRRVAEGANVDGAREVIELAEQAPQLRRLVHWSTALVSGARRGYVHESELDAAAGFRNVIEETRFRAEGIVRGAMGRVPTTILRPSIVVGDATTGEIDRFDGPYLLVLLMLNAPMDLRIPLPGRGDIPLNVVPVDYVVAQPCASWPTNDPSGAPSTSWIRSPYRPAASSSSSPRWRAGRCPEARSPPRWLPPCCAPRASNALPTSPGPSSNSWPPRWCGTTATPASSSKARTSSAPLRVLRGHHGPLRARPAGRPPRAQDRRAPRRPGALAHRF
jgi:nucleoside-diphosphate-sugar epimerase